MGLLDILGSGTPQANMLGQGLLGMGAGLLQGGAYGALGPSLGKGLLGFQQGEQNAQDQQRQAALTDMYTQAAQQKLAQQQGFADFFRQSGQPGAQAQPSGAVTFPVGGQSPTTPDLIQKAIRSGNPLLVDWGEKALQANQAITSSGLRGRMLDQSEWSAPVQTSNGFVQVNRVTGQARMVTGNDGKPLLPTTVDPTVQRNVSYAKGYGTKSGQIQAGLPQQGKAAAGVVASANQGYDRLIDSVNELLNAPGLDKTLGVEGMFPNWPGSDAANAAAKKKTLDSQVAFTVLQALRDASKTGGAVGQVSDKEEEMMKNNLAALDNAQSPEEYRAQLKKILDFATQSKQRMADAFKNQYGVSLPGFAADTAKDSPGGVAQVSNKAQYDALPSGSYFVGPDGKNYRKP